MVRADRFLPERAPIDAYGNGGFRFADMSHQGSLLILAGGMHAWRPSRFAESRQMTSPLFSGREAAGLPAFRHRQRDAFSVADLSKAFADAGIALEAMTTGAAVRTYNILLAEKRDVSARLARRRDGR